MRFKTVLGILVLGGAVAYAQKRRAGGLTLTGFRASLHDLGVRLRSALPGDSARAGEATRRTDPGVHGHHDAVTGVVTS